MVVEMTAHPVADADLGDIAKFLTFIFWRKRIALSSIVFLLVGEQRLVAWRLAQGLGDQIARRGHPRLHREHTIRLCHKRPSRQMFRHRIHMRR